MKTKSIGKVLSVILSICMLISLFTCLGGLSASATSTNMIVWNAAPAYSRLLYRPNTGKFEAGTKYVLLFDIELTNITEANEPFYWRVFYCNNNSTFTRIAHANFDITKTALKNGYHYDVKFTVPTDCRNYQNILLKFGDTGSNGYEQTMKLANLDLWSLDGDDNQVSQIELSVPSAISDIQQVTDANQKNNGVNGAWVCPKDYLKNITIESQNGYFDPVVKMLSVNSPDTSARLKWRPTQNTNVINPSTDYRLSFYWENISNASLDDNNMFYVKYYNNSSWSVMLKANDPDGGAATDVTVTRTDVAHGQKVDIDFTSPADCRAGSEGGSIFFLFGDWAYSHANMQFNFGELKLYTRDGSDNLTEVAMDDICANSVLGNNGNSDWASSDGLSRGQVYAPSTRHSCISFQDMPDKYFDPVIADYVHFEPNRNNNSRFLYKADNKTYAAGNYRFTMDCKIFSGNPVVNVGSADNGGDAYTPTAAFKNYTASYDEANYKYTVTFTLDEPFTESDSIGVCVGNYGSDGNFVCANPELYLLDGSGDPTGDNIVETFASAYYKSSVSAGYWNRVGNYTCTTLPENYFDTEDTSNFAGYFSAGEDNYQVMAYKDTGVYIAANTTYRLVIDVNNFSAIEPTVQMRTGSEISTSYTGTLISTNGFERVYEFTVTSAATGFGLFLGNYGKGTDLSFAFRKPRLYMYSGGAYTGVNMLAPFSAANHDRHDWSGSRANALNGKWTPLNCSDVLFRYGTECNIYFDPADINNDAAITVVDLVMFKSARIADPTDISLDLDGNSVVNDEDHLYLIDMILVS